MKKLILIISVLCFFVTSIYGNCPVYAQEFRLPAPGERISLSPEYNPPILKGIKVHTDNPFRFEFILDQGDDSPSLAKLNSPLFYKEGLGEFRGSLKQEATKLIKYFLASLTIPENDLWVNLSPYEKDRIIPNSFGMTEMGRDLLAEDYMLKQITASLVYPEGATGKKFWKRIYEEAYKKFGTTNIPVNTFNKVWIVPDKAVVYENAKAGTAYVVESRLKVMLEEDYLSMAKHADVGAGSKPALKSDGLEPSPTNNNLHTIASQIIREIVIPELDQEVNQDRNFAQLRQVYNSLILATWYKKKIKDSILEQVYVDKNKTEGITPLVSLRGRSPKQSFNSKEIASSPSAPRNDTDIESIYQRYLQAFKKGVYNYIKEEPDLMTNAKIPRKYFSGGFTAGPLDTAMSVTTNFAQISLLSNPPLKITINLAMFSTPAATVPKTDFAMIRNQSKRIGDVDISEKYRLNNVSSIDAWFNAFDQELGWADRNELGDDLLPFTDKEGFTKNRRVRMRIAQLLTFNQDKINEFFKGLIDNGDSSIEKISDFEGVISFIPQLAPLFIKIDHLERSKEKLKTEARFRQLMALISKLDAISSKATDFKQFQKALRHSPFSLNSIKNSKASTHWDSPQWRKVANIIAAADNSPFHRADTFRDEMTEAILHANPAWGHRKIFYHVAKARMMATYRSWYEGKEDWRSASYFLNAPTKNLFKLENNKNVTGGRTEAIKGHRELGRLYDLIKMRLIDTGESSQEFKIPGSRKKYVQTVISTSVSFVLPHVPSNLSKDIIHCLDLLWKRIFKSQAREDKYKALAEYEWWFFQANLLGRGGASIGDAMSIIAQRAVGIPLRKEFENTDFNALSLPLDKYVQLRVREFEDRAMKVRVNGKVINISAKDLYEKVWVLRTGGTIEMSARRGRMSEDKVVDLLREHQDEIAHSNLVFKRLPDSSNIGPVGYEKIIAHIKEIIKEKRRAKRKLKIGPGGPRPGGLVITTGTDTVEHLAIVLALEFGSELDFPIVLTAAARPLDYRNSDAPANFSLAIHTAQNKQLPPQVYFAYGGKLFLASRIKKFIASTPSRVFSPKTKDFESYGPIAAYWKDGKLKIKDWLKDFKPFARPAQSRNELPLSSVDVEHLVVDNLMSPEVLKDTVQRLLKFKKLGHPTGLIIQGNITIQDVQENEECALLINKLFDAKIPVFTGSRHTAKLWGIMLLPKFITYSKARLKLSWLLSKRVVFNKIAEEMKNNYAGEIIGLGSIPEAHKDEIFPQEYFARGKEVIVAYPGIKLKVFKDAIQRLNNSGATDKEFIIYGFGDGHLPVGNVALETRMNQWLKVNCPWLLHAFKFEWKNTRLRNIPEWDPLDVLEKTLTEVISEKLFTNEPELKRILSLYEKRGQPSLDLLPYVKAHPNALARRFIKDALASPKNSLLGILAEATDSGIKVFIRTSAFRSATDTRLYEHGQKLLAIGVDSQVTPGWPSELVPKSKTMEVRKRNNILTQRTQRAMSVFLSRKVARDHAMNNITALLGDVQVLKQQDPRSRGMETHPFIWRINFDDFIENEPLSKQVLHDAEGVGNRGEYEVSSGEALLMSDPQAVLVSRDFYNCTGMIIHAIKDGRPVFGAVHFYPEINDNNSFKLNRTVLRQYRAMLKFLSDPTNGFTNVIIGLSWEETLDRFEPENLPDLPLYISMEEHRYGQPAPWDERVKIKGDARYPLAQERMQQLEQEALDQGISIIQLPAQFRIRRTREGGSGSSLFVSERGFGMNLSFHGKIYLHSWPEILATATVHVLGPLPKDWDQTLNFREDGKYPLIRSGQSTFTGRDSLVENQLTESTSNLSTHWANGSSHVEKRLHVKIEELLESSNPNIRYWGYLYLGFLWSNNIHYEAWFYYILEKENDLKMLIDLSTDHRVPVVLRKIVVRRLQKIEPAMDSALKVIKQSKTGGIDLTPANMKVQVKNGSPTGAFGDDGGIKFHIDPAMLAQLQNAPGFVPVIINIEPMRDLRRFLEVS